MNYYAKIVAEKLNAKFKVGDKVALGEIVKGPIKMKLSQTPVYEIKTPEGKIISRYEEEIKRNEKDEKENGKVFDTWDKVVKWIESQGYEVDSVSRYRPTKWIICYKDGYEYEVETFGYSDGDFEIMGKIAKVGPKKNSKDEKDNDIGQLVKGLRRKELEKEGFDKKTIDYLTKKNEEEKSYYAKIVERKHNASETDIRAMYTKIQELKKKGITGANIDKYYAAINTRKQAEDFLRKFKETGNKDYKYAAENLIKKAEQLEAEVTRNINK